MLAIEAKKGSLVLHGAWSSAIIQMCQFVADNCSYTLDPVVEASSELTVSLIKAF